MPHCPNCGAEVDQSTAFCPSCGESLQGGQGQPQQGQPPQGQGQPQQPPQGQGQPPQGQGQPQQPPQGQGQPPQGQGQPQQPPQGQGQPQQPPQGQPPQGQGRPPQGPPPGQQGGTSRRNLLMYGGGAAVVLGGAAGGWFLLNGGSGGGGLSYGATVQGEITSGDQQDPIYGKLATSYHFSGSAGDRVQIEMRSDSIDPYLILTDGNGNMVAENDDITYGVNLNSRIRTSLPTSGQYTIWCASYGGSETGTFTLSLSQV
ncbi:MAG: zinc-ribbon domain-containing protein [Haloarculaceae archaeon]